MATCSLPFILSIPGHCRRLSSALPLTPCSSVRAQSPPPPSSELTVQHNPYSDPAAPLCYNLLSHPFSLPLNRCLPRVNTVPASPKSLLFLNLLISQSQSDSHSHHSTEFLLEKSPAPTIQSNFRSSPHHQVLNHHLLPKERIM